VLVGSEWSSIGSGGQDDPAGQDRTAGSASARSLLLTVLGELVHPRGEPVWTSSLLYVLTGLGLERSAARQAVARAASAGWFSGERRGREVRWRLAGGALDLIEDGRHRVHSLRTPAQAWEGDWLILLITIPQARRSVRKRLYTALSWAGFGNPTAGTWVCPHLDRADEARRIIEELDLGGSTISLVGPAFSAGLSDREIVRRAWDLDAAARRYAELMERFPRLEPAPGDDTLFTHIALVNEWQRFPFMDPQLPEELLPGWVGRRAADQFVQLYRRWAPGAHQRWDEVVRGAS
jgi:phenylacetic acid degradation operon negative regulatory protein